MFGAGAGKNRLCFWFFFCRLGCEPLYLCRWTRVCRAWVLWPVVRFWSALLLPRWRSSLVGMWRKHWHWRNGKYESQNVDIPKADGMTQTNMKALKLIVWRLWLHCVGCISVPAKDLKLSYRYFQQLLSGWFFHNKFNNKICGVFDALGDFTTI